MWDIMDNSVEGLNAQALIFDKNGIYIAHTERKKVYLKESFPDSIIINEITNQKSGHKIYNLRDGIEMIAAYAPLNLTQWGIVIQQPIDEAFAEARTMKIQVIILVISSIIIASLIAYVYARRIVRPVNQLISGIQLFSTGDLKYRIPLSIVVDDKYLKPWRPGIHKKANHNLPLLRWLRFLPPFGFQLLPEQINNFHRAGVHCSF